MCSSAGGGREGRQSRRPGGTAQAARHSWDGQSQGWRFESSTAHPVTRRHAAPHGCCPGAVPSVPGRRSPRQALLTRTSRRQGWGQGSVPGGVPSATPPSPVSSPAPPRRPRRRAAPRTRTSAPGPRRRLDLTRRPTTRARSRRRGPAPASRGPPGRAPRARSRTPRPAPASDRASNSERAARASAMRWARSLSSTCRDSARRRRRPAGVPGAKSQYPGASQAPSPKGGSPKPKRNSGPPPRPGSCCRSGRRRRDP